MWTRSASQIFSWLALLKKRNEIRAEEKRKKKEENARAREVARQQKAREAGLLKVKKARGKEMARNAKARAKLGGGGKSGQKRGVIAVEESDDRTSSEGENGFAPARPAEWNLEDEVSVPLVLH